MASLTPQTDREVLVAIDSKLSSLVEDVRDMKAQMEKHASVESVSGLELRIRHTERRVGIVERKMWMASGAFAVVLFVLKFFVK